MRRFALLAALLCSATPAVATPLWAITDNAETVSAVTETDGDATLAFYCEKPHKTVSVVLGASKPVPEDASTVEVRVISGQNVSIRQWTAEEGVAASDDSELISDLMTDLLENGSLRIRVVGTEIVFLKGNLDEVVAAFTRGCGR